MKRTQVYCGVVLCGLALAMSSLARAPGVGAVLLQREPGAAVVVLDPITGVERGAIQLQKSNYVLEKRDKDRLCIREKGELLWVRSEQFVSAGQAERVFREGVRKEEGNATQHCGLGLILGMNEKWSEAEAAFRRAVELKGDYAEALYGVGLSTLMRGKYQEAVDYLTRARRIRKDHVGTESSLGLAWAKQGKFQRALPHFEKARTLDPWDPNVLLHLGFCHEALGQNDEALKVFQQLTEKHKTEWRGFMVLGRHLFRTDRLDEAVRAFQEAIRLREPYGEAHHFLGRVYLRQGKVEEAILALSKAQPQMLADSYLTLDYEQRIMNLVRQGATASTMLDDRRISVTRNNVEEVAKQISQRMKVYEQVFEKVGYLKLESRYTVELSDRCKEYGFTTESIRVEQKKYHVTLVQGEAKHRGVCVGELLLIEHTSGDPDLRMVGGPTEEETIKLFLIPAGKHQAMEAPLCAITLTKER